MHESIRCVYRVHNCNYYLVINFTQNSVILVPINYSCVIISDVIITDLNERYYTNINLLRTGNNYRKTKNNKFNLRQLIQYNYVRNVREYN